MPVSGIGSAVVEVAPGDHFKLIARQTFGSTKNVAADELTWFALEGSSDVPFSGAARDGAMVARWSCNPLNMLWPDMGVAFVSAGGGRGPPPAARRPVVTIAAAIGGSGAETWRQSRDERKVGMQNIASAARDVMTMLDLVARQTSASTRKVVPMRLTWLAIKLGDDALASTSSPVSARIGTALRTLAEGLGCRSWSADPQAPADVRPDRAVR